MAKNSIHRAVRFAANDAVGSWRDVMEQTLNAITDLEPEAFDFLAQQYPRLITKKAAKLRSKRELSNGFYVETHLSAKDIHQFCLQAIEAVNLSSHDWIVGTR